MRNLRLLSILMVFSLLLGLAALADTGEGKKAQTNCPVSGKAINKDVYTDYKGYRVYFCCPHCPDQFAKDPDKYIKKMEAEGITLEKAPQSETTKASNGCTAECKASGCAQCKAPAGACTCSKK